jgi:hypothetical protein
MDQFARTVLGFHGCTEAFARRLLTGELPVRDWHWSKNVWDWLGHGIYFWEHSPHRALRWAKENYEPKGEKAAVVGAVIQLGDCFDLLNEAVTGLLAESFTQLEQAFQSKGMTLPHNTGKDWKRRERDCLVINDYLAGLESKGKKYDTVRGAFTEGEPVYPGAGFSREAHIQIAVRNIHSILGVFLPTFEP